MKQAWDNIRPETVVKSFNKCGINNALNGTENYALFKTMIVVLKIIIRVLIMKTTNFKDLKMNNIIMLTVDFHNCNNCLIFILFSYLWIITNFFLICPAQIGVRFIHRASYMPTNNEDNLYSTIQ